MLDIPGLRALARDFQAVANTGGVKDQRYSLGQALNAVARAAGYRDWNAALKSPPRGMAPGFHRDPIVQALSRREQIQLPMMLLSEKATPRPARVTISDIDHILHGPLTDSQVQLLEDLCRHALERAAGAPTVRLISIEGPVERDIRAIRVSDEAVTALVRVERDVLSLGRWPMDEAWSAMSPGRDHDTRAKLMIYPGVPNYEYVVKDNDVYVFDKLCAEFKAEMAADDTQDAKGVVTRLLMAGRANATPLEAVTTWRVSTYPYRAEQDGNGYRIAHDGFNARLPAIFASMDAANQALAGLLAGTYGATGAADFTYRGVGLQLLAPNDPSALPPRPVDPPYISDEMTPWIRMRSTSYVEGYGAFTAEDFSHLARLEASWKRTAEGMKKVATGRLLTFLRRGGSVDFSRMRGTYAADVLVRRLRSLFPEMSSASDGTLQGLYEDFCSWMNSQNGCHYLTLDRVTDDPEFLVFALGALALHGTDTPDRFALMAGEAATTMLVTGKNQQESLQYGRDCQRYLSAVDEMATRVRVAMDFLTMDAQQKPGEGARLRAPVDMADLYRQPRKWRDTTVIIQDMS